MPGFVVGGGPFAPVGGVRGNLMTGWPNGRRDFYYKYTWDISNFFDRDGVQGGLGLDGSNPLVYLRDATLPTFTAQSDSIIGTALEYKWAKSVMWDDIKVSWYDSVGLVNKMKQWRWSVWSEHTGLRPQGEYKKNTEIRTYLPNWDNDTNVRWRLHNSWPKVIKHGELTYTQSEVKIVEVTVSYDWAVEHPAE
jgi:hypothetical protein